MEAGDQAGVVDAPRARGPAFDLEHGEGAGGRIAQEGLDRRAVGAADDLVRVVDALGDDLHRSRRDDVGEAAGDRVVDEAAVEREPVVFRISGDKAVGADGAGVGAVQSRVGAERSEEHTSELPSLMRISSAVLCLKKNNY